MDMMVFRGPPGEDQAERYSLSYQVDKIAVPKVDVDGSRSVRIDPKGERETSYNMSVSPDGTVQGYSIARQFTGKKLDEVIGKEMARKVMEAKEPTDFEGEGLKVGGEGMKGFYDKIVPDYLNKFGKKYNAKVGNVDIDVPAEKYNINDGLYEGPEVTKDQLQGIAWDSTVSAYLSTQAKEALRAVKSGMPMNEAVGLHGSPALAEKLGGKIVPKPSKMKSVQYLPITPEMRQSVGQEGVPLFNRTLLKEDRPDAPEINAKRDEINKRVSELEDRLATLNKEEDVWRDIAWDASKYTKAERDEAWDEKRVNRNEWWKKWAESARLRAELNRIQNPSIGALREDASGRKTLWLSKDAMWVVQYATKPGIGNVFSELQGVSYKTDDIPKLIKNIELHFGPKSRQADIVPQVKGLLTEAANRAGKEGVTIVGAKGRGLSETAKIAREEMNHAWQREMSADGSIGSHLKPEVFEDLDTKIPTGAKEYLSKHKYDDNPVTNVAETAAKFMSGAGKEMNVSPADQAYWLHDYFQSVIDEHGPEAFNTLNRVMGVAKELKEEALSGKENKFDLSKRAGNQGNLGSQQQVGGQGNSGSAGSVAGEGKPLFNREQVKTPEFKKFFGDSKIVDDKGEPMVVYHGTREDFDTFNPNAKRESSNSDSVLFFSSHPAIANTYSGTYTDGANIKPVYLSIQNPLVKDGMDRYTNSPRPLFKDVRESYIAEAKKKGHDGVIINNTSDRGGSGNPDTGPTNVYIAFYPEQD
jgi:hypothetical protein